MAQCPTGYAPRLFWPGSHFYGFMGAGRNLRRPVYSGASTFASWVAAASPLVTNPPSGLQPSPRFHPPEFSLSLSLSLSLPSPRLFFLFSKVPPRGYCRRPTCGRHPRLAASFFRPPAPRTMVTPCILCIGRQDRRLSCSG